MDSGGSFHFSWKVSALFWTTVYRGKYDLSSNPILTIAIRHPQNIAQTLRAARTTYQYLYLGVFIDSSQVMSNPLKPGSSTLSTSRMVSPTNSLIDIPQTSASSPA
jgi:hypothetical protein